MQPPLLFDTLPPYAVFIVFFVLMLFFFESGFRIGKWRKMLKANEDKAAEPMIGGVLGLLAFVLAFSFNIASSRYEIRKENVVTDANTITTAFFRADLIPEPQRSAVKARLIAYTKLRADVLNQTDLKTFLKRLSTMQVDIWKTLSTVPAGERNAVFNALASALTAVFDIHEKRINDAIYNRMGNNIWFIIFSITFLSMFMLGVRAGFSEKKTYVTLFPFILALTLMVYLITDLDNPQAGFFRVSQQPILDALSQIKHFDTGGTVLPQQK